MDKYFQKNGIFEPKNPSKISEQYTYVCIATLQMTFFYLIYQHRENKNDLNRYQDICLSCTDLQT